MTPTQVQLLRGLALSDRAAVDLAMRGAVDPEELDPRTASLLRVVALFCVGSDPATFRWAVEEGIACGVEDGHLFATAIVLAPIIGMARMTASLPHLLEALDLEVVAD